MLGPVRTGGVLQRIGCTSTHLRLQFMRRDHHDRLRTMFDSVLSRRNKHFALFAADRVDADSPARFPSRQNSPSGQRQHVSWNCTVQTLKIDLRRTKKNWLGCHRRSQALAAERETSRVDVVTLGAFGSHAIESSSGELENIGDRSWINFSSIQDGVRSQSSFQQPAGWILIQPNVQCNESLSEKGIADVSHV
jgi:hypothetical protein